MNNIEETGVSYLKISLLSTNSIAPNLNVNDKEPIWDGHLYIYTYINDIKRKYKNDDLLGRIPVQIKTHIVEKFNKKNRITKMELQKFALEQGVLYYVIQIDENSKKHKIYYYELYNIEVRKILAKMTDKDSITIEFEKLNTKKPKDIYYIHKKILERLMIQIPQNDKLLCLGDVLNLNPTAKFSFNVDLPLNFTIKDIKDNIYSQKPYLCYHSGEVKLPIERINEDFKIHFLDKKKLYFEFESDEGILHYMDVIFKDEKIINISIDSIVNIKSNSNGVLATMKYNIPNDIKELKNLYSILKNLFSFSRIKLIGKNSECIQIFKEENNLAMVSDNLKEANILYDFYYKLSKLLDYFNITKKIDIKKITKLDIDNINNLYNNFICNDFSTTGPSDNEMCHATFVNYKLLLYSEKIADNKYKLYDFFLSDKVKIFSADSNEQVNNYFALTYNYPEENAMTFFDNINLEYMLEKILIDNSSKWYLNLLNTLMLQLIDCFDCFGNFIYLNTAKRISNHILENDASELNYLNHYQIKYREDLLNDSDIIELTRIKNTSDHYTSRCCASILLKNKNDFEYYYSTLGEEERKNFDKYPIHNIIIED